MLKQLCGQMLPSLGFGLQKSWPNFKPFNRDCLEIRVCRARFSTPKLNTIKTLLNIFLNYSLNIGQGCLYSVQSRVVSMNKV